MPDAVAAVFGGSFDPPHCSHLAVVLALLARGAAGRVLVVPCARHVFGKPLAPFHHRLAMCRLVCAEAGPGAETSDIEGRLGLEGFTVDMLRALAGENPGVRLRLVIGADILAERDLWHAFSEIERIAPPIVVGREGASPEREPDLPAPPGISSTQVRSILASGGSAVGLVPPSVERYILDHGLYGSARA